MTLNVIFSILYISFFILHALYVKHEKNHFTRDMSTWIATIIPLRMKRVTETIISNFLRHRLFFRNWQSEVCNRAGIGCQIIPTRVVTFSDSDCVYTIDHSTTIFNLAKVWVRKCERFISVDGDQFLSGHWPLLRIVLHHQYHNGIGLNDMTKGFWSLPQFQILNLFPEWFFFPKMLFPRIDKAPNLGISCVIKLKICEYLRWIRGEFWLHSGWIKFETTIKMELRLIHSSSLII